MSEQKNNSKDNKLQRMLRMTVFVDNSFAPLFTVRFRPFDLVAVFTALFIIVVALVVVLIAFTSLREFIPGYPSGEDRLMMMQNKHRADSLFNEMKMRDVMFDNLRAVLNDEIPEEAWKVDSNKVLNKHTLADLNKAKSVEERNLVSYVEEAERYDVSAGDGNGAAMESELEATFFYSPIKGFVTDDFGMGNSHFGVDVVSAEGTPVMSMLDGTVVFAEWTVQTGNVIMIQHDNQLLTVYKHNSKLLKKQGERVRAGEAVAIIGNSGELSSGPHLHFEIWHKATALNPKNYISFEPDKQPDSK